MTKSDKKKKPLPLEQVQECAALKRIQVEKKITAGITQTYLAENMGMTQAGISNYLNATNALNVQVAIAFARELGVKISDFSPRLAALASLSPASQEQMQELSEVAQHLNKDELLEIIELAKLKLKLRDSRNAS